MNDDGFEAKLRESLRRGGRPDPTPVWKEAILARALAEVRPRAHAQWLPPRWLMIGWAAAWVAALLLKWSVDSMNAAAPYASKAVPAAPLMPSLFAYQEQLKHFEQP